MEQTRRERVGGFLLQHPVASHLIPALLPLSDFSHDDVPPRSDPQRGNSLAARTVELLRRDKPEGGRRQAPSGKYRGATSPGATRWENGQRGVLSWPLVFLVPVSRPGTSRRSGRGDQRPRTSRASNCADAAPVCRSAANAYSIAKALETIATGLLSDALESVTRPKLMVRPSRTMRASASTSEDATARMKCVVWSTVVIGR